MEEKEKLVRVEFLCPGFYLQLFVSPEQAERFVDLIIQETTALKG